MNSSASSGVLSIGSLLFVAALCGCEGTPGELHTDFEQHRLETIAVSVPENLSVWPLDDVEFGGLLQRAVLPVTKYHVPLLLQRSLVDGLRAKGYQATAPRTSAEASPPRSDAVLVAVIETWKHSAANPVSAKMNYRLEIRHLPSGTVLYSSRATLRGGGSRDTLTDFLPRAMDASARRALSSLPERAVFGR